MNRKIYKISNITLWCLLVVNLIVFLSFTGSQQQHITCGSVNIEIDNQASGNYFVDKEAVDNIITNHLKIQSIIGTPVKDLNPYILENELLKSPFIKKVKVYKDIPGNLNIQIIQKRPLARVFTDKLDYYIDEDGKKFTFCNTYTARVPVVNGYFFEGISYKDSMVTPVGKMVYNYLKAIDTNAYYKSLTESIYINEEGDLTIVPKIGPSEIIFGDDRDLSDKLNKLHTFYSKVLNTVGYNHYKSINLKFRNEVVCK